MARQQVQPFLLLCRYGEGGKNRIVYIHISDKFKLRGEVLWYFLIFLFLCFSFRGDIFTAYSTAAVLTLLVFACCCDLLTSYQTKQKKTTDKKKQKKRGRSCHRVTLPESLYLSCSNGFINSRKLRCYRKKVLM